MPRDSGNGTNVRVVAVNGVTNESREGGEIMATWVVDYANETIEGPFNNKDEIIQFLLYKLDDLYFVDTLQEAKESGFRRGS